MNPIRTVSFAILARDSAGKLKAAPAAAADAINVRRD